MEDEASTAKNRRSPSPAGEAPRKLSQPKPITRNTGVPKISGGGGGAQPGKLTSPKRVIASPPLSSISEEDGGSPKQGQGSGKERLHSDSGFNGSLGRASVSSESDSPSTPRRRVTMSVTDLKKPCPFVQQEVSREAESVLQGRREGGEDTGNEMDIRTRTSTISSSAHRYYKERGRKNSKQLKQEAAKLERSPEFHQGKRKIQALELFSPDMELRIREKICSGIGKKYGGLRRANQAAVVIQTAYRQYKLKKRYDEIRREAIKVRRRAQTISDPRRKPSMLRRKRPNRYQRQVTALAGSSSATNTTSDPLLQTKLRSQELGRESIPHTSSRRALVERQRTEPSQSEETKPSEGTSTNNAVVSRELVNVYTCMSCFIYAH